MASRTTTRGRPGCGGTMTCSAISTTRLRPDSASGPRTTGVPHRAFLRRAHRRGARFAVGSDSHFELLPLDRTETMIREAEVGEGRFLDGGRAQEGVSTAASS